MVKSVDTADLKSAAYGVTVRVRPRGPFLEAKLIWATPDGDKLIGYMARVSNPKATPDDHTEKLISYLLKHDHWSPFEMANMCVEIHTTRDIARQILRHRSFSFQEFSQRYAEVTEWAPEREARLQDPTNRQNSIQTFDSSLRHWWNEAQDEVKTFVEQRYRTALHYGIAKEVARSLLPEGLTPTRMYMNGSVRSWLTYFSVRTGNGTQLEHINLAWYLLDIFEQAFPMTYKAWRMREDERA